MSCLLLLCTCLVFCQSTFISTEITQMFCLPEKWHVNTAWDMRQTTSSSSSSSYKWGSTKAKKSSCGVSSCIDWLASLCVCSLKRTKAENISDNVFMLSPADKLYSSHSFSPAPSDMQQQSTEWVIVAYKQKSINCSQTDKWSSTDFLRGRPRLSERVWTDSV